MTNRILFLSPYPPYPPRSGGATRIYHLLAGLAREREVVCLTFAPDIAAVAALAPLRELCQVLTVIGPPHRSGLARVWTTLTSMQPDMALRNADPTYTAALRLVLRRLAYDTVFAASIEMAVHGLAARGYAAEGPAAEHPPRLVLDQFNAEYVLQQRAAQTDLRGGSRRPATLLRGGYSQIQWRKLARYERRLLQAYDQVLAVSAADRAALLRLEPAAEIAIVPNGVDCAYFRPGAPAAPGASQDVTLVFTGALDYRPNIDAVNWFAHEVLPLVHRERPDAKLVIVGRSPATAVQALHDGARIEVVGEVADVRPYIAAAAVYVVPMRIGGGVRLKLLEALAMQAPVVSTPMGAEGVPELCDGEQLLLADSPQGFAAAVLQVLADPARGQQLGIAGRATVATHYDWQAITPRLATLL